MDVKINSYIENYKSHILSLSHELTSILAIFGAKANTLASVMESILSTIYIKKPYDITQTNDQLSNIVDCVQKFKFELLMETDWCDEKTKLVQELLYLFKKSVTKISDMFHLNKGDNITLKLKNDLSRPIVILQNTLFVKSSLFGYYAYRFSISFINKEIDIIETQAVYSLIDESIPNEILTLIQSLKSIPKNQFVFVPYSGSNSHILYTTTSKLQEGSRKIISELDKLVINSKSPQARLLCKNVVEFSYKLKSLFYKLKPEMFGIKPEEVNRNNFYENTDMIKIESSQNYTDHPKICLNLIPFHHKIGVIILNVKNNIILPIYLQTQQIFNPSWNSGKEYEKLLKEVTNYHNILPEDDYMTRTKNEILKEMNTYFNEFEELEKNNSRAIFSENGTTPSTLLDKLSKIQNTLELIITKIGFIKFFVNTKETLMPSNHIIWNLIDQPIINMLTRGIFLTEYYIVIVKNYLSLKEPT
jgi:hypothetical protein